MYRQNIKSNYDNLCTALVCAVRNTFRNSIDMKDIILHSSYKVGISFLVLLIILFLSLFLISFFTIGFIEAIVQIGFTLILFSVFFIVLILPMTVMGIVILMVAFYKVEFREQGLLIKGNYRIKIPYSAINDTSIEYPQTFRRKRQIAGRVFGFIPKRIVWLYIDDSVRIPWGLKLQNKGRTKIGIGVDDPVLFVHELQLIYTLGQLNNMPHFDYLQFSQLPPLPNLRS